MLLLLLLVLLFLYFYWNPKACGFCFYLCYIFTLRMGGRGGSLRLQIKLRRKEAGGGRNVYNGQLWDVLLRRRSSCSMPKCTWRFLGTANGADGRIGIGKGLLVVGGGGVLITNRQKNATQNVWLALNIRSLIILLTFRYYHVYNSCN